MHAVGACHNYWCAPCNTMIFSCKFCQGIICIVHSQIWGHNYIGSSAWCHTPCTHVWTLPFSLYNKKILAQYEAQIVPCPLLPCIHHLLVWCLCARCWLFVVSHRIQTCTSKWIGLWQTLPEFSHWMTASKRSWRHSTALTLQRWALIAKQVLYRFTCIEGIHICTHSQIRNVPNIFAT